MKHLGVISSLAINHHVGEMDQKKFELFKFLDGRIGLRIDDKKKISIFEDMEEFKEKARTLGLSSEYINLASQIFE